MINFFGYFRKDEKLKCMEEELKNLQQVIIFQEEEIVQLRDIAVHQETIIELLEDQNGQTITWH